jgi:hypothetical protein
MQMLFCHSCHTRVVDGRLPDGWYQLSVNDRYAPNKKYRYLGLFCSIACIEASLHEFAQVEHTIRNYR